MSINVNNNVISSTGFNSSGEILNTPLVVTDGLILWLDAGNNASYINSSNYYDCGYGCQYYSSDPGCTNCNTQWKDMSGYGNDGTINGVTFLYSDIGGSSVYAGANQLIITPISTFENNMTWCAWIKCYSDVTSINMFMGRFLPYFGFYGGNSFYFSNTISGTQRTIQTATSYSLNTWYYATFTTEVIGGNTEMRIYVNGVSSANNSFAGTQGTSGTYFALGDGTVSSWYRFNGEIPIVMVYNRRLTSDEIIQNYNNGRQRFGI
jgi:hypothetical protein